MYAEKKEASQPIVAQATAVSGDVRSRVRAVFDRIFGPGQWAAAEELIQRESGFQVYVTNPSSGACGLFQSLPCSKVLATAGTLDNVEGQAEWGASYIKNRYGSPTGALAFHNLNGWY